MYNFNYHCPSSLQEAESLYAKSEDPMFLAGGHTLLPTMKQRLNAPTDLIDLAGLTELAGISREGDVLQIGATRGTPTLPLANLFKLRFQHWQSWPVVLETRR